MPIAASIHHVVGQTPMVFLGPMNTTRARIALKLESLEPCSSVKDRIAKSMIEGAEARGQITAGKTTLVEPTSGNTGVGLAFMAAAKGYSLILTMPETMSLERRMVLLALGARIVLTPGPLGMKGAVAKANEITAQLNEEGQSAVMLQQFENPDNPRTHYHTTGPEIWADTDGAIEVLVAGVGTGGTITGAGQFLKEQNPAIRLVAVEPKESPVLSGGQAGPHKIQGIGAGFVPQVLNLALLDEIAPVSSEEAMATTRRLALEEGLLGGISSGAAVHAALKIAQRPGYEDKLIVVIIPSFGERYLSAPVFEEYRQAALALQPQAPHEAFCP
ncbi:MAG: cysteine synthase A [Vampirovibrionales bacterium]